MVVADSNRADGGVLNNLACHSRMTIDLASLQSRDGARRVFAGPGSLGEEFNTTDTQIAALWRPLQLPSALYYFWYVMAFLQ